MYIFLSGGTKEIKVYSNADLSSPNYLSSGEKIIEIVSSVQLGLDKNLTGGTKTLKLFGHYKNAIQSQKITELLQQPYIDGYIMLYELDLNHVGLGTLRFTSNVGVNNQPISFGNNQYLPVPIESDGFEANSQGSQSRPTIKLSAQNIEITSLLLSGDGLQGAKVTRICTFARFLDTGEEPDGSVYVKQDQYIIDKISEWVAGDYVSFELRNALDLENSMIPYRRVSKLSCDRVYRLWNAKESYFITGQFNPCPYVADVYYNMTNERVYSPHEDICNKSINACALRFGKNNVLPFGGFPGTSPQGR